MADQLKEHSLIPKLANLEMQIDWFHDFVDYVQNNLPNTYDNACVYADDLEKERLSDG